MNTRFDLSFLDDEVAETLANTGFEPMQKRARFDDDNRGRPSKKRTHRPRPVEKRERESA